MKLSRVEIFTYRLLLLPLSQKYKEDIFREFTKEITTYMYPRPPENLAEAEDFINSALGEIQTGNHLTLVILKKRVARIFGMLWNARIPG